MIFHDKTLPALGITLLAIGIIAALKFSAAADAVAAPTAHVRRVPGTISYAANAPQLSSLKIAVANAYPMPVTEPMNGRIAYNENVTTRVTSPLLGRIVGTHAEIGDRIARHAVLLDIDSPDLATAEADWRKAQADEVRKQQAFLRARNLFEHEVVARKDYESANADYAQAVAETRRASLRMKNLNASGSENGLFGLRAPIGGIVADKQVNPGMEVRPDLPNPLFVISDLSHLWVIIDVPEKNIASIKPGQAVSIDTDANPDQRFEGKVERVGLVLDPTTRRIQVRCSVFNQDNKLRPEMFARVAFLDDQTRTGVRLPNTSLIVDGIHTFAFVEKSPGILEKRRVSVALRGREQSYLESGVTAGELVVTEGTLLLNSEVAGNAN